MRDHEQKKAKGYKAFVLDGKKNPGPLSMSLVRPDGRG